MKIDSDGLKALYKDYVRSRTPATREGCPGPEQLLRMLRGEGQEAEKTRVVDHVSQCGECARELDFLLEAVRAETTIIQDLERQEARASAARRRPFYFRFSWGLASLLVAAAAAGFFFWKTVISPSPETYRATSPSKMELIGPRQVQPDASSLVFRWKPVKDADFYIVEVFDEALTPLWKSDEVPQSQAIPSAGLKAKLAPGRTYFWMVTAHFPEKETTASPLQEFRLKN
jgi:hypothetical protein